LTSWGYRRCEDIVWLKTNKNRKDTSSGVGSTRPDQEFKAAGDLAYESSVFVRSKEHCLMGIRGTVRRGQDSHLINSNLDIDVIVDEMPSEFASTAKPEELYNIIERFCLSRRRLELFGSDRNIRPGWITIGNSLHSTQWAPAKYAEWTKEVTDDKTDHHIGYPEIMNHNGGRYLGTVSEIEALRPKSPVAKRNMISGGSSASFISPPPSGTLATPNSYAGMNVHSTASSNNNNTTGGPAITNTIDGGINSMDSSGPTS